MKPALVSLFLAIFQVFHAGAQGTSRLDSLNRVYSRSKYDTSKVLAQLEIAQELGKNDPDTLIILAANAKVKSEKLDFQIGIGYALIALGSAWRSKGDYEQALRIYLEAEEILSKSNDRQGIAKSLSGQGSIYRNQGLFDKALELYQKSLKTMTKSAINKASL